MGGSKKMRENVFYNEQSLKSRSFTCSYCGKNVSSDKGYFNHKLGSQSTRNLDYIYICHSCGKPTYFNGIEQHPKPKVGGAIEKLPEEIRIAYEEIRSCYQVEAYTAVVMLGRKMLMHIACKGGAKEGANFTVYVDYLEEERYTNRSMTPWLDKLRIRGNKANHKLDRVEKEEAAELFKFIQMFLKTNYEFAVSSEESVV